MTISITSNPGNMGHGHVFQRTDGVKAKCGGPNLCGECANDLASTRKTKWHVDGAHGAYECPGPLADCAGCCRDLERITGLDARVKLRGEVVTAEIIDEVSGAKVVRVPDVFDRELTFQQVDALIWFYESTTGKKAHDL